MTSSAKTQEGPGQQRRSQNSDVDRCFRLLSAVIDGQATSEEVDFFNRYVNECMPLYQQYQLETAIKEILHRKVAKRPVPPQLIDSIRTRIKEATV